MVDVLSGSRLKLARARQHLSTMHAAMRKYIEMEFPQEAENSRLELSDKWQALTWLSVPDTDPMIGTVLGDFAHNLRCALDHAMWALVDANGQKPGRHTQFPGAVTESDWRDAVTHRDPKKPPAPTTGLSTDAFQLVEDFQPFTAGQGKGANTWMHRLLRLSNDDKHRTLYGAGVMPATAPEISLTPPGYVEVQHIKYSSPGTKISQGAEFARVKLRIIQMAPEEIEVKAEHTQGFSFGFFLPDKPSPAIVDSDLPKLLNIVDFFIEKAAALPEVLLLIQ